VGVYAQGKSPGAIERRANARDSTHTRHQYAAAASVGKKPIQA